MAEEHGFQPQEGHILCANNCGFFGSPAMMNLCSKCYRDFHLKEERDALAKSALEHAQSPKPVVVDVAVADVAAGPEPTADVAINDVLVKPEPVIHVVTRSAPNRCFECRKRVGLTGFKCRCGSVYCGAHRYAEKHGCTFDYKKEGKEAIAKANPLVKAEKLEKI